MSRAPTKIVGIGASAGGLDAFHTFFHNMPTDSGMAFVVILHLPIGQKSMLPEILGRWTTMKVLECKDGASLEANCVYVPPPHAITTIVNGCLRLRMPAANAPRDYRPIDGFFDALAATQAGNAIGIVLSGTGSDGALGLKAIKQCGGFTIAQGSDGSSPQYDSMPAGAIATGAVDLIASVEAIPGHLRRMQAAFDDPTAPEEEASADREAARLAICTVLREQIGHDFSGYRTQTFMRRVHRRMQVLNISKSQEYVELLGRDHEEVVALFRDLLIRVTSFFRDVEAFEVLETAVMPRLFANKYADSAVRVWVPGCATGEEAYSLAILLREQMDRMRGAPKVQIFGTDIDESAIETARLGRYPATLLDGLSPDRRQRFFHDSQNGYAVSKEIRDLCTFSPHSIVRDPPFSRMDMISCRNLLIYMDTDLQAAVIPSLHYSLVADGILLLGIAESTSRHQELFEPLDKARRIFKKRNTKTPPLNLGTREPNEITERRTGKARPSSRLEREDRRRGPESSSMPLPTHGPSHGVHGEPNADAVEGLWSRFLHAALGVGAMAGRTRPKVGEVERRLAATQGELQSVREEHETALEELRSANEELHSVNEELQSTNEELETSKEELQSVNEELHTVNAQLSEKIEELDRSNNDLRNLFDSTQVATIFLDRFLIVRSFTPAAAGIYNLIPSDQGRPLTDISSRLRYNSLREDVTKVIETLQPLERRVTRDDDQAHYVMRVLPYRSPDSSVSGTLITYVDVTSIVQAEQHQRLLVDELNHRVKNMLSVVISLAAQTLRRSATMEEFSKAFMGRVQALTASYTLLSSQNWVSVSLRDVLTEETKPYAAQDFSNISMTGPHVRLTPTSALTMGMAIHELATNALKYGALSIPDGSVSITWRFERDTTDEFLVLDWVEENGPVVQEPSRRGFGTTLVERGFAHELSGSAKISFDPKGVSARLRAPIGTAVSAGTPPALGSPP